MHLELQKINSNSSKVLEAMPQELIEGKVVTSVLGIEWNCQEDTLRPKERSQPAKAETKREALSLLAGLFDPLGEEAPLTCQGKLLMQQLWQSKLGWDDQIPKELCPKVDSWLEAMGADVPKIPRHWGRIKEIHIFCDASEEAYAACAYATSEGTSTLIAAKTRVKPLKEVTIPRLELQGAVLAADLHQVIQRNVGVHQTTFWTDSTIVHGWIQAESTKYKAFVGNRVYDIQRKTNQNDWKWVPGTQNPADIPSRGIWPLKGAQQELWLKGPRFIINGEHPPQPQQRTPPSEEVKKAHAVQEVLAVTTISEPQMVKIDRFSSINRLLNTMSYVFRFVQRKTGGRGPPEAEERLAAQNFLIQQEQNIFFQKEMQELKEKGAVSKQSSLAPLNPKLQEGVIVTQTRVQTEPSMAILHPKSHLTRLLVREQHKENLHSGVSHTLNSLRQRFWILKGFATVKAVIQQCVTCQKANGRLAQQQMAPLPEWRTTPAAPFSHTGVDYAGPLLITKTGMQKRYVLLFTCGVTRAVHLELTPTLEVKDFILSFDCFTASRGIPSVIHSDNGTTFVAAAKALPNIKWEFITPLSPWHGGHWERIVRSIKTPLRKIAGGGLLKENELRVLLTKIEGVINDRPIGRLQGDEGGRVLTPFDLLAGRPRGQVKSSMDPSMTRRVKHLEQLNEQFWRQWRQNYLMTLQQRGKWRHEHSSLKKGDVVLLAKENCKRHTWPLAKIIKTVLGRDGAVRSVKLLCDGKEVMRPIQLVVPLEVQDQ